MYIVYGTDANDTLYDLNGDNLILGMGGNDQLIGNVGRAGFEEESSGNDTLDGGDGDDRLVCGTGDDVLIGGSGIDTVVYANNRGGVFIDLGVAGPQDTRGLGIHKLLGIENVEGTSFADTIIGNEQINVIASGLGDDTVLGAGGMDTAVFQHDFYAATTVVGVSRDLRTVVVISPNWAGTDWLHDVEVLQFTDGAYFVSQLVGMPGVRPLYAYSNANGAQHAMAKVYSGPVAHLQYEYVGSSASEAIAGGWTHDFLTMGAGDDAVDGQGGDDVIDGGSGSNFLTGGTGRDVFFVDARAGQISWSTITDWEQGEELAVWGWQEGISQMEWAAMEGAIGYQGATLHMDIDGNGVTDVSVTWTGVSRGDLPVPQTFGSQDLLWFHS